MWETHQALKARLIDFVRRRTANAAERRGEPAENVTQLKSAMSLDGLTIGFARRFATYKRANLVLEDFEAIASLVSDPQTPIQFVFAERRIRGTGRAKRSSSDRAPGPRPAFCGQGAVCRGLRHQRRPPSGSGRRRMAQQPRRPLEASGTSGQKVVLNGGLNLSILDGWWAEAYDGRNGFAIGGGETHRPWTCTIAGTRRRC